MKNLSGIGAASCPSAATPLTPARSVALRRERRARAAEILGAHSLASAQPAPRSFALSDASPVLVATLLERAISASENPFADASAALQPRMAADIIGTFEARLTKTPPAPASAPNANSTGPGHYAQLRAAYKKRASEYHPDRVAALGKDLRELATRRMTEINAARDALLALLRQVSPVALAEAVA